jgi:hypothetical protein
VTREQSPIELYVAGGGTFANPGVAALMMEAQRGYNRRNEPEPWSEEKWREDFRRSEVERADFLEHCRPAEPREYSRWLKGYLRRGGKVTHPRDREIGPQRFYVLESTPDYVPSLYGALSFNIIVPAGVLAPADLPRTFHGRCGHSGFFFMAGFEAVSLIIESFTDANGGLWERG